LFSVHFSIRVDKTRYFLEKFIINTHRMRYIIKLSSKKGSSVKNFSNYIYTPAKYKIKFTYL
jgi:hypothetical protein